VESLVFKEPQLHFTHLPLRDVGGPLFQDSNLVCGRVPEVRELNEHTGQRERVQYEYCHGKKYELLCADAAGKRFVAWQFFVDETRWTIRHGRKVHGLYARPVNHPHGCWELLGLIPTLTDAEGVATGLSASECVLAWLAIVQACISCVILGGGMEEDASAELVADPSGKLVVRADLVYFHRIY
jgi:hypothetical protein